MTFQMTLRCAFVPMFRCAFVPIYVDKAHRKGVV